MIGIAPTGYRFGSDMQGGGNIRQSLTPIQFKQCGGTLECLGRLLAFAKQFQEMGFVGWAELKVSFSHASSIGQNKESVK
jgi:hypothetical protein